MNYLTLSVEREALVQVVQTDTNTIKTNIGTNPSYTVNSSKWYDSNYCTHKLPCGYCAILQRPCLRQNNYSITYTTTTSTNDCIN